MSQSAVKHVWSEEWYTKISVTRLDDWVEDDRIQENYVLLTINPLTPNDPYRGRTAPLTSKRCILYIYSTNIGTEYFKHSIYSPFFSSSKCSLFHNSNVFGSRIIHILYTECAKIKKKIRHQRLIQHTVLTGSCTNNCTYQGGGDCVYPRVKLPHCGWV